jgi:hypothetical protein
LGTFHDHMGELHGITVVVRQKDGNTWIGRCHSEDAIEVILHDADQHVVSESDESPGDWLSRARQMGHWPRVSTIRIARETVSSLVRLADINQKGELPGV